MSSFVLNWVTLFQTLFPHKSFFPIEPQVFGCTCFVRDVRPHVSKLDPKSLKYIFLGYLKFRRGIGVIVPLFDITLCLLMLHSLKLPRFPFVSYNHLSSSSCSFIAFLDSISLPHTIREALSHLGWHTTMVEEMQALDDNGSWNLVQLPAGKKAIGCRWVFAVKFNPDGSVTRLKERLVAKGYAQTYGVDYSNIFSPIAKMTYVRLFISLVATYHWNLHQLDIKNVFLHGDLQEEVYMEQPPRFVAQGEIGRVFGLRKSLYSLKQSPRAWFGKFS